MTDLKQLEMDIEACRFQLTAVEIMRWGHEDLLESLKGMLAEPEFAAGHAIHCKVSFASLFKQGPIYGRIKHVCPDFVITDSHRHPVAILDYQGAGHDAALEGVKRAVACKTGMAFVQVPREWTCEGVKAALLDALAPAVKQAPKQRDAHALQEMLKQDFAKAA